MKMKANFASEYSRELTRSKAKGFGLACCLRLRTLVLASFFTCLAMGTARAQQLVAPILYNQSDPILQVPDLYLTTPDGSVNRRLPLSPDILVGADTPVWSRDGQNIAVTGAVPAAASMTLGISNATGTHVVVPVGNNAPVSPWGMYKAFSPDGTKLAYTSLQGNYADFGIVNVTGPTIENLLPGIGFLLNPAGFLLGSRDVSDGVAGYGIDWSPVNSNLLVASSTGLSHDCGIPLSVTKLFLVRPVLGGLNSAVSLTSPPQPCLTDTYDFFPVFSPDGAHVAFVRETVDMSQLWGSPTTTSLKIITTAGTYEHTIKTFPEEMIGPVSWSQDGKKLAFGRSQMIDGILLPNNGEGVWTINVDGTGLTQLRTAPASNPAWAPKLIPLP